MTNKSNIEFIRQVLQPKTSRPQMGLAIYPTIRTSTEPTVTVSSTALLFENGASNDQVSYVGKTLVEVAAEINRLSLPLRAVALGEGGYLGTDDLVSGTGDSMRIPSGFPVHDRTDDNGVIIRTTKYTVKYKDTAKIRLLPPYFGTYNAPWYPRLSIGSFSQEFKGRKFKFSIPEYSDQTWSSLYGMPFKDMKAASVSIKDTNILQLPRYPIHWDGNNLLFYVDDAPLSNLIIDDIDVHNGLVYVKPGFFPNGSIQVDYTYLETSYLYPYLNINAHFSQNPSLIDKFVIFYLKPIESTVSVRTNRTVFHVVADNLQEGIDSIEVENPDVPTAIIGAYSIQQVLSSDRVTILDTRSFGGGLVSKNGPKSPVHSIESVFTVTDDTSEAIEDKYDIAKSFWDIGHWDGEPYPGAAAIVMSIPNSSRIDFDDSFIKTRATKFIAAGVYPVIDFYKESRTDIPGYCQDVSCFINTGLDMAINGASGVGWLYNTYKLPSGSFLLQWSPDFEIPNVKTTLLESKGILTVSPGSGVYQYYLKSNPASYISWKERSVFKSKTNMDQETYSDWKEYQVIDSRDVNKLQLMKGVVSFNPQFDTKQYKDINVYSVYNIMHSGEFKESIASEISNIVSVTTGLCAATFDKLQVDKDIRYSDRSTHIADNYFGIHPRYEPVIELASKGYSRFNQINLTGIGLDLLACASSGYNSSTIFSEYNTNLHKYQEPSFNTISIAPSLSILSKIVEFNKLGHLAYIGVDPESIKTMLKQSWTILNNINTGRYISPDIVYTPDRMLEMRHLNLNGDPGETNPAFEDHRITEMLPVLSEFYVGFPAHDSETLGSLTGMPDRMKKTFDLAFSYMPLAVSGSRKNSGSSVAQTWLNSFDRFGEFAGSILYDSIIMTKNFLTARITNGGRIDYSGCNDSDLTYYFTKIREGLNYTYSGFSDAIYKGGSLDYNTAELLYSYGWFKTMSGIPDAMILSGIDVPAPLYNSIIHEDIDKFYALFCTGLKVYAKSITTIDGSIKQKNSIKLDPTASEGSPPSSIFKALALGLQLDYNQFMPLAQGMFHTLTGRYSNTGCYPFDCDLKNDKGGYETEVLKCLVPLYGAVNTYFP